MLLGINNQDWKQIGWEAASIALAPLDIYRGIQELSKENPDKWLAYNRIFWGVVGTIPMTSMALRAGRFVATGGRAINGASRLLRTADQMSRWEKINKSLGTVQSVFQTVSYPLWIGGSIYGGYHFISGVFNWDNLDSQNRAQTLMSGLVTFAPAVIGFGYGSLARKRSEVTFKEHPDLDYFAMKREQLGPFPSTETAPKYPWQGKVDVDQSAGTMTITYDTTGPSKILTGASGREKLQGMADLLRYGFGSWGAVLPAIYRGNRPLLQRMANQWADTVLAKIGNVRGIKIQGINHIPDEKVVFLALNHVNMTDFVAMRRVVDSVPTASSSGFDQAITIKPPLRWVPVLGQFVGLSSWLAGRRLQPVVSGKGDKALRDNMAYLSQTRSPRDAESALRHLAIFVYGPGTRTVGKNRQGNPPDDPRIIWEQTFGAFNTAAHAKVPLVPMSFYYKDNWVHVQFHQPVRPESQGNVRAIAKKMMETVAEMIQKDLIGAGYFTRYMDTPYRKHHGTGHTGMFGGN